MELMLGFALHVQALRIAIQGPMWAWNLIFTQDLAD